MTNRQNLYWRIVQILGRWIWSVCARIELRAGGATCGAGLLVQGRLRLHIEGKMTIGHNVRINSGRANFVGASCGTAAWVCPKGAITIGDGCAISNSTLISAERIDILPHTFIGGGCEIYDTDFHPLQADARVAGEGSVSTAPVRIGPRAFIGARCIILKGVTIGEGAIIGAGSVVTRSVPQGEIWAGNPVRFIKPVPGSGELSKPMEVAPLEFSAREPS